MTRAFDSSSSVMDCSNKKSILKYNPNPKRKEMIPIIEYNTKKSPNSEY